MSDDAGSICISVLAGEEGASSTPQPGGWPLPRLSPVCAQESVTALKEGTRQAPSDAEVKAAARAGGVRGKFHWVDSFFEYLADSFRPILGVLLGAPLIIAFAAVLDALACFSADFCSASVGRLTFWKVNLA